MPSVMGIVVTEPSESQETFDIAFLPASRDDFENVYSQTLEVVVSKSAAKMYEFYKNTSAIKVRCGRRTLPTPHVEHFQNYLASQNRNATIKLKSDIGTAFGICLTISRWSLPPKDESTPMWGAITVIAHYMKDWYNKMAYLGCVFYMDEPSAEVFDKDVAKILQKYSLSWTDKRIIHILMDDQVEMDRLKNLSIDYLHELLLNRPAHKDLLSGLKSQFPLLAKKYIPNTDSCAKELFDEVSIRTALDQPDLMLAIYSSKKIIERVMTYQFNHLIRCVSPTTTYVDNWWDNSYEICAAARIPDVLLVIHGCSVIPENQRVPMDVLCSLLSLLETVRSTSVSFCPSSHVLPSLHGLRLIVQTHVKVDYLKDFHVNLDEMIQLFANTPPYVISAVLDPRYRLDWCKSNESRETFKNLFISNVLSHNEILVLEDFYSELENYLSEPCCDVDTNLREYWVNNKKRFPTLVLLVLRYVCVPFALKDIQSCVRGSGYQYPFATIHQLDSEAFEDLLFFRCNSAYIDA